LQAADIRDKPAVQRESGLDIKLSHMLHGIIRSSNSPLPFEMGNITSQSLPRLKLRLKTGLAYSPAAEAEHGQS